MNVARPRETDRSPAGARSRRRRAAVAAASLALLLLGACSRAGDLGRPAPNVVGDRVLPFAGRALAEVRGEPAAWLMHTDDERELRARAWRFLMPAHEWQVFERVFANLARTRVLPPGLSLAARRGYWDALVFSRETSPAPLFRRIAQDAESDRALVPPLVVVAERTLAADQARLAMLRHVRALEPKQAEEAALRVAENRCLIAWIASEARERVERYRYALERLVIEAPQREAIGAERAIAALEPALGALDALQLGPLEACGHVPGLAPAAAPAARAAPSDPVGEVAGAPAGPAPRAVVKE